jgi:hypothetical protein
MVFLQADKLVTTHVWITVPRRSSDREIQFLLSTNEIVGPLHIGSHYPTLRVLSPVTLPSKLSKGPEIRNMVRWKRTWIFLDH